MSLDRFERALLKSGAGDRPSPARRAAARNAVLRAAGVTAVAAATVTTTSSAAAASAASAGVAATAKGLGVAKLVLLSLLSAGALTAAVVASRQPNAPVANAPLASAPLASALHAPEPARPAPIAAPILTSTSFAPSFRGPGAPSMVEPAEGTARAAMPQKTSPRPAPRPPSPAAPVASAADPVAVEARILEAARACLGAGDRGCARAQIEEHRLRFAHGALVDEASILAIDLAVADGDRDEARRAARALVARRPDGWPSRIKLAAEAPAAKDEAP